MILVYLFQIITHFFKKYFITCAYDVHKNEESWKDLCYSIRLYEFGTFPIIFEI